MRSVKDLLQRPLQPPKKQMAGNFPIRFFTSPNIKFSGRTLSVARLKPSKRGLGSGNNEGVDR